MNICLRIVFNAVTEITLPMTSFVIQSQHIHTWRHARQKRLLKQLHRVISLPSRPVLFNLFVILEPLIYFCVCHGTPINKNFKNTTL